MSNMSPEEVPDDEMESPRTQLYRPAVECKTFNSTWIKEVPVGLGGLGVTCSPRDPRFACSNPAEVHRFFQDVKILSTSRPGGTLSWGSRV